MTSADRVLIEIRRRAVDREVKSREMGAAPQPGQMPRVTIRMRAGWELPGQEVVDHKPGSGFVELCDRQGNVSFVLTDEIAVVTPLWP